MSKLILLKGLPASGKTKWAKEMVISLGHKRVNKDDLREMIDSSVWGKSNENQILLVRNAIVVNYLQSNFNVIVDDTNFAPIHEETLRKIAEENSAEFEVKFFDVSVNECIKRDLKRGDKSVGSDVIWRMYEQFIKPTIKKTERNPYKEDCYIFDIDGTLAEKGTRSPFDFSKVKEDKPIEDVVRTLREFANSSHDIIIVSGRDDSCQRLTEDWLIENSIYYTKIFMRKTGDKRKDSIVKKEIYDTHIKDNYNVLGVFDDRDQVVEMWRNEGLTCFQVNYGSF